MEKELTLLEKFAAGWEIRSKQGHGLAINVIERKSMHGAYILEFENGVCWTSITNNSKEVTCTPPRERRWVNVWVTDTGSSYAYQNRSEEEARKYVETDDLGGDFIATLCIERVDGKWQLVKDENA